MLYILLETVKMYMFTVRGNEYDSEWATQEITSCMLEIAEVWECVGKPGEFSQGPQENFILDLVSWPWLPRMGDRPQKNPYFEI